MKYRYIESITVEFDTDDFPEFFEFDGTDHGVKVICDEFGTGLPDEMPAKYYREKRVEKI